MKLLIVLCLFLLSSSLLALEKSYQFKDFDQAEESKEFLRFDMESTKLGFITTSFNGFVKQFTVSYDLQNNLIMNGIVTFQGESMDTDIDARNEKMWEECLDTKKHPTITIKDFSPIEIGKENNVKATMNIRGKDHPITLMINAEKKDNRIHISGKSDVGLKQLGIPDPSIMVASVRDKVEIVIDILL